MLKELRAKRKKTVADMRAMVTAAESENREFTAEENAAYEALQAALTALDAKIGRLEQLEAAEAALEDVVPAVARGGSTTHTIVRAGGPEASREFESFGHFMAAVRFNPNDQRLNFVEGVGVDPDAAAADPALAAEMRMDQGAAGGFMVPATFRPNIMRVAPEASLVRPRAQVIEAGDSPDASVTLPALDQDGTNPENMYGGVAVQWIEEGGAKPETDARLKTVTLTPHEVAAHTVLTDKLLRNWRGSSAFIEGLLRGAVTGAEDFKFLRGLGVGSPLGAINSGAMKYINRTTANVVVYNDLVSMVARILMRGGAPVWSMSQAVLPQIAKLKDENNNIIWHPNAREGFAGDLLGYPVRWNNRSPALGSKGDVTLSDWSHYLIKDGAGPFVATSEHVKFLENKTVIKIFWNVDGAPWMKAPIKEENGYEVSPFVGLDIPA